MSQTTAIPTTVVPALPKIPLRGALPWFAFGMLLAMMLINFVGAEQGALSMIGGTQVHEFVHDARHLLGFPCH